MTNEIIDVLIPAYNAEKHIKNCLNSLLLQTYKDLRIVIVDDGSKDNTYDILKEYSTKYKKLLFSSLSF